MICAPPTGWPRLAFCRRPTLKRCGPYGEGLLRARADQAVHRHHHRRPVLDAPRCRPRSKPTSAACCSWPHRGQTIYWRGSLRDHGRAERAVVQPRRNAGYVMPSLTMAVLGHPPMMVASQIRLGLRRYALSLPARSGIGRRRSPGERAGARHRRLCRLLGLFIRWPRRHVCWRSKVIRSGPSSCCRTWGRPAGACPIPAAAPQDREASAARW